MVLQWCGWSSEAPLVIWSTISDWKFPNWAHEHHEKSLSLNPCTRRLPHTIFQFFWMECGIIMVLNNNRNLWLLNLVICPKMSNILKKIANQIWVFSVSFQIYTWSFKNKSLKGKYRACGIVQSRFYHFFSVFMVERSPNELLQ